MGPPPRILAAMFSGRLAALVLVLLAARTAGTHLAARHRPAAPAPVMAAAGAPETARADGGPGSGRPAAGPPSGPVVPPGMRVVRIEVEPEWRLPAGSVVDVLAPADPGPLGDGPAAAPARVVAAGAVVLPERAADRTERAKRVMVTPVVTLLVTLDAARQVAAAAAAGPLSLALAPPEDACCRRSSSGSSRD